MALFAFLIQNSKIRGSLPPCTPQLLLEFMRQCVDTASFLFLAINLKHQSNNGGLNMPNFRYNKLCFSCSTPISSNRSDQLYCDEKCCTYSTRMRLKYMPHLTTREWIAHVESELNTLPLEQLKHPIKKHPINEIVPKLLNLQEQLNTLLPERFAL